MTHKISTIFHTSTHVNAPIHLLPEKQAVGDLALDRFFGTGLVLSIPKGKWEQIEPADLEKAVPAIAADDIVLINTGWHRRYSDSQEYCHAPGPPSARRMAGQERREDRLSHWSSARRLARSASQRPQIKFSA
jgi:kynurenine formamidase